MNREEIQRLLGGYATGTLTAEEQQALFAAALEDQQLFDELAREQSLRDLLGDPAARAHLLAALDQPAPAPWFSRWWKPMTVAAMALAVASVVFVTVRQHSPVPAPVMVAKVELPAAPAVKEEPQPTPPQTQAKPTAPAKLVARPDQAMMTRDKESTFADLRKRAAAAPPPPPAPAPQVMTGAAGGVAGAGLGGVIGGVSSTPKDALKKDTAAVAVSAEAQVLQPQAAAPGFRATNLRNEDLKNLPAAGNAVSSGKIAEAKAAAPPADARTLFYGTLFGARGGGGSAGLFGARQKTDAASAAPATHLGIQYRVLRKNADSDFVESDATATGSIPAGAYFKLQITGNDAGYVRVLQEAPDGTWHEILNHAVERMQPIETPSLEWDQPGRVKFYLTFARQPLPPSNVPQPDDDLVVDRGRVVTVAGRNAGAPQLSFNLAFTIQ